VPCIAWGGATPGQEDLKNNLTNPMLPPPLTQRYAFSVFTNLSFFFFIVNKALNLIRGCVPCVAWDALGRNPRLSHVISS